MPALAEVLRLGLRCRYDPDHKESLLCESNTKRAQQTFNNLRLSCNVAGNCELQVRGWAGGVSVWVAG